MTNKQMTYHESYGELPVSLLRLIRKFEVTPADFYEWECRELTFDAMAEIIRDFSPKGYYNSYLWNSSFEEII